MFCFIFAKSINRKSRESLSPSIIILVCTYNLSNNLSNNTG